MAMFNPFLYLPDVSNPTFGKGVDRFLKEAASNPSGLDERGSYNLARIKTVANRIYTSERKKNDLSGMVEIEGIGSKKPFKICNYLESLRFSGPYKNAFLKWIDQLAEIHEAFGEMEKGSHKLQAWMPDKYKKSDMEEKKWLRGVVGRCLAQLNYACDNPQTLREIPYIFYGHLDAGGLIMYADDPGMFVIRSFFDTMLTNPDYFSSFSPKDEMAKKMSGFDEFLGNCGLERKKEMESFLWPLIVMYSDLEFEPYSPMNSDQLLAICDRNSLDYKEIDFEEFKPHSWQEHKFRERAEELYAGDPEVQEWLEGIKSGKKEEI